MQKRNSINIANLIIKAFDRLFTDVMGHGHNEYWMDGGRGSTKSSFISICIVMLIITFPYANAVVIRRFGNTLRDSVYNQVLWAIAELELTNFFKASVSPMEITYLPTGQKIVFRGMDDPLKLKGVKFTRGYGAIQWFEELDQFAGWAAISSALKSIRRGGDTFWTFYSYNPPRTSWCWVNKQAAVMEGKPLCLVNHSTYLDVIESGHADWLGQPFIEDAEWLRETNELQYRWEMLGEPVGNGTEVFDRVEFRSVTDAEIMTFDNQKAGQDFGWYPDPWAFVLSEFQASARTLISYREDVANKLTPPQQAERIKKLLEWPDAKGSEPTYHYLPIMSDDADPQSIASQRDNSINARAAGKGNMRDASYKWLQSIHWIIDPQRCPHLAEEARAMQYEVNKDGEVLNTIPDGHDHCIDAVRYSVMPIVHRAHSAYRSDT